MTHRPSKIARLRRDVTDPFDDLTRATHGTHLTSPRIPNAY
jgi:hypothetical protein